METLVLVGPSEYTTQPVRVRLCGPFAYYPQSFRVFSQDLPRTLYKEARETRVLENTKEDQETVFDIDENPKLMFVVLIA